MTPTPESPLPLKIWRLANQPGDTMIYKDIFSDQIIFVRHRLAIMLYDTYEEYETNQVQVVGTHTFKSILLPVYQLHYKGLILTIRYNFYDWGVVIQSDQPINLFGGADKLFNCAKVDSCCEGFSDALMALPAYDLSDHKNFRFGVSNKYYLFTAIFVIKAAYIYWLTTNSGKTQPEPSKTGELPVKQYGHNPAHAIGTCGQCGNEMVYNVPRMGAAGGFVHKTTGKLMCEPNADLNHGEDTKQ